MKLHISRLARILSGAALLALLVGPATALAHEHRTIANGKYDVTVGWTSEPTYVDLQNSASIRIMDAGTTNPVKGAEKTLKLSIKQGASQRDFPLSAVFGQDGFYTASVLPTRVGDYQWIFTGNINGDAVNETFDTADGKFDAVVDQTALQFPVAIPGAAQSSTALQAAQADAQSARMLAYGGIAVGVLGLLVGIGAWLFRPRPAAVSPATTVTGHPASERV